LTPVAGTTGRKALPARAAIIRTLGNRVNTHLRRQASGLEEAALDHRPAQASNLRKREKLQNANSKMKNGNWKALSVAGRGDQAGVPLQFAFCNFHFAICNFFSPTMAALRCISHVRWVV
jgi:hypothetical protein